jgi:hypothetical protein
VVSLDSRHRNSKDAAPADTASGGLSWYVKAFLIAVMLPVGFNLGPIALDILRSVLLMVIVPLFLQLLRGAAGKLLLVDYLLFAHVAWMALSLIVYDPAMAVEPVGILTIEFLGAYLVGRVCIRTKAQFIQLSKWIAALVLVTLPFAILESQTGRPIILDAIRSIPGVRSHADVYHPPRMGLLRAQVVFIHPIHYGLFCSVALPLVFVGLRDIISNTQRVLVTGLVGLCCFLSLSSGAVLAVLFQIFLIVWAYLMRNVERRWFYLSLLMVFCYVVVDLISNRTPLQVFLSYATFSSHTAYWRSIIFEWGVMNVFGSAEYGIVGRPIFGLGFDDWVRPSFMVSGSMDNYWLVIAVRFGLPALVFLGAATIWTLWRVGRRDLDADPVLVSLRRAWVFLFIGLSFTLATVHIWGTMYSYVSFLFGAGIWLLSATPARQEDDAGTAAAAAGRGTSRYSRFEPRSARPARRDRAGTAPLNHRARNP